MWVYTRADGASRFVLKTEKAVRKHVPTHITTGTIAAALRQGLKQKREAVGQGSSASPNARVCVKELWQATATPTS